MPGELVGRSFGEFVLRERIGEGGFGAVYRATQTTLDREAVVKVLHDALHSSANATERFLREAKLASRIDHPYAAHIYAFGAEPDGELWIAMELVRGIPLDQLLKAQGTLSLERLSPLLDRICEVVHSAHEQGIIHRDLKPANVMVLARAGRLLPKLLDLGIAKGAIVEQQLDAERGDDEPSEGVSELTYRGAIIGSPAYIAPEQWVAPAEVDARADLYALGIMAYECLTGGPPFTGKTLAEIALAHAEQAVPLLGSRFPAALDSVFAKVLAKNAQDRYPDALAFAEAFRQAAGVTAEAIHLPTLEPRIRDAATSSAPQPIAEAVAGLEAARNAHQARDAMVQLARTTTRYLGLLALACRSRVTATDEPPVTADLIRTLHLRSLTDAEWLELGRTATTPWTDRRDAYPIPELVDALQDPVVTDTLVALSAIRDRDTLNEETLYETLEHATARMSIVLDALEFLAHYPLVVMREEGVAERWMGVRRSNPPAIAVHGRRLAPETVALLGSEGAPVLVLAPLFQAIAPMPGEQADLFLLEGRDQRGAKLVALPAGFEAHDDEIWDWLRVQLGMAVEEDSASPTEEHPPYIGLDTFSTSDALFYFGREALADTFVNRLKVQTLIAVVGPSGAGKSSFVQAGVVPALPPEWRAITMRPGATPLAALALRLEHEGFSGGAIHNDREALGTLLRNDAARRGPVLLVVDQLEEIFTLCQNPEERIAFVEALASAARAPDYPVRIVVTLRDDFLARTEQVSALRDRIGQGIQLLTVPPPSDLVRILVEPARRAGYSFEDPALPEDMVKEVADLPGALALLSFTARKLWDLRDRHFKQLTRSAYKTLGGVGGALARHADDVYDAMPPEERSLAREAFRQLVTTQHTRAVLARADLRQLLGSTAHGDRVIEKLVAARLLVASENEAGKETIEIVHEALLTGWPRLVEWLREDSEGARLREQLRSAAEQWHERKRPRGLLWRGDALADLKRWRARHSGPFTDLETAFSEASIRDAATGRRIRSALLAVTFITLAAGIVTLALANARIAGQRRALRANLERQFEDQGRRLVLAGDPLPALAYLQKAGDFGAGGLAHDLLLGEAVRSSDGELFEVHHDGAVRSPMFSPDGTRLVTAGLDRQARVWDARTGQLVLALKHDTQVVHAAFSPDGATVLTGTFDGTATVWNLANGQPLAKSRQAKQVQCVAFSPDGKLVVTTSDDDTLLVWDALSGTVRARGHGDGAGLGSCAFSPDGTRVAAGDHKGVLRTWDVARGKLLQELRGHQDAITSVRYAPDGDHLATASNDGNAIVWDLKASRTGPVLAHEAPVSDARFSTDGKLVITASADRSAVIWDAVTGARKRTLGGHGARLATAVFSPDTTYAVTVSDDAAAWLWDLATGHVVARWRGHRDQIQFVEFDHTGHRVVTASEDGAAIVWSVQPQEHVVRLAGHAGPVLTANFSPDGTRVVTAGGDGTTRLWDAGTGKELQRFLDPANKLTSDAVLAPDGQRLATASDNGKVRIWDLASGTILRTLSAGEALITQLRWAPDGTLIVASSIDGSLHCWDSHTGDLRFENHGHDGYPIMSAVFAPDGKSIITSADTDPMIRVWALDGHQLATYLDPSPIHVAAELDQTGTRLLETTASRQAKIFAVASPADVIELAGHTAFINYATWSRDGQLVITASTDRTARLWDAQTGDMLAIVEHSSNVLFASFSPDNKHFVLAGEDGIAEIHDVPVFGGDDDALGRIIRCRVPVELRGDRLRSRPLDRRGCNGS